MSEEAASPLACRARSVPPGMAFQGIKHQASYFTRCALQGLGPKAGRLDGWSAQQGIKSRRCAQGKRSANSRLPKWTLELLEMPSWRPGANPRTLPGEGE
jgi:hypothetical protein